MTTRYRGPFTAVLIGVCVISSLAIGASAAVGQGPPQPGANGSVTPPPPRPWLRPDGTIDYDRLPECIRVAGLDGRPAVHEDGRPVCLDRETYRRMHVVPAVRGPQEQRRVDPNIPQMYDARTRQWVPAPLEKRPTVTGNVR